MARASIIEVLAISAALHGVAIAWISKRPHDDRRIPFALPKLPPLPSIEPEPTTVVLFDDHTVTKTGHGGGGRGRARGTSQRIAVTSQATGEGPAEVKGPSLMSMRGHGGRDAMSNGMSGDFLDNFLANGKPLPPPIEKSGELHPDGRGMKSEHRTFTMKVAPDGTVDLEDGPNLKLENGGASFDVTDLMMRRHGQDPYASAKLKVLDETREERVEMGKQYRTQQLARSRELMDRNIQRLVRSTTDVEALKQGLFDLWDDCAETGPDELVVAGAAAREQVIAYIRGKLPHAYSAQDLARLNKLRRSQLPFEP